MSIKTEKYLNNEEQELGLMNLSNENFKVKAKIKGEDDQVGSDDLVITLKNEIEKEKIITTEPLDVLLTTKKEQFKNIKPECQFTTLNNNNTSRKRKNIKNKYFFEDMSGIKKVKFNHEETDTLLKKLKHEIEKEKIKVTEALDVVVKIEKEPLKSIKSEYQVMKLNEVKIKEGGKMKKEYPFEDMSAIKKVNHSNLENLLKKIKNEIDMEKIVTAEPLDVVITKKESIKTLKPDNLFIQLNEVKIKERSNIKQEYPLKVMPTPKKVKLKRVDLDNQFIRAKIKNKVLKKTHKVDKEIYAEEIYDPEEEWARINSLESQGPCLVELMNSCGHKQSFECSQRDLDIENPLKYTFTRIKKYNPFEVMSVIEKVKVNHVESDTLITKLKSEIEREEIETTDPFDVVLMLEKEPLRTIKSDTQLIKLNEVKIKELSNIKIGSPLKVMSKTTKAKLKRIELDNQLIKVEKKHKVLQTMNIIDQEVDAEEMYDPEKEWARIVTLESQGQCLLDSINSSVPKQSFECSQRDLLIENPLKCTYCPYTSMIHAELDLHMFFHREESVKPNDVKCNKSKCTCTESGHTMDTLQQTQTSHICTKCEVVYESDKSLKKHICCSYPKYTHKCTECNCAYKKLKSLKIHMSTVHTNTIIFECLSCSFTCDNYEILKLHTNHQGKLLYTSKKIYGFPKHQVKPLKNCTECSFVCSETNELERHAESHKAKCLCKFTECSFSCNNANELKRHMVNHQDKPPYKCTECSFSCSEANEVKRHMVNHEENHLYKCTECSFSCNSSNELKRHMVDHQDIPPYKCTACTYTHRKARNLRRHMVNHKENSIYKCTECSYSCNSANELKRHMVNHQDKPPYKCTECSFVCSEANEVKRHMVNHEENSLYKCTECSFSCNNANELKRHMVNYQVKPPYKCTECSFACSETNELKRHMVNHEESPLYTCTECSFNFNNANELKRHMVNYQVKPPYKCTECSFACSEANELKRHMVNNEGNPLYKCTECSFSCNNANELNTHNVSHKEKPLYKCNECSFTHIDAYVLMIHMANHHVIYPYKCTECSFAHREAIILKRHMVNHQVYPPFKCTECPFICSEAYELMMHMVNHQENPPYDCTDCFIFSSDNAFALMVHIVNHQVKPPYKCSKCTVICKTAEKLTEHLLVHQETAHNASMIAVTHTNMRQSQMMEMDTMNLWHNMFLTNYLEPVYTCVQCPMTYYTSEQLQFHVIWVHG